MEEVGLGPVLRMASLGGRWFREGGEQIGWACSPTRWARKEETNLAGSGLCSTLQTPSFTHCPSPRNCRDEWTEKTTAQRGLPNLLARMGQS